MEADFFFSFVLFNYTWSQQGHPVSCMTMFVFILANHQIRYQATSNLGYQPGDCRLAFNLNQGFVLVCMD